MHHRLGRALRRPQLIAMVAAGALLLGACSSNDSGSDTASGDFEPVTIEHALGTAEITEQPERIVTLGMGSAETVIALGSVPVGIEEYPWGSDETGYLPWIHEELTERGEELPTSSPAEPRSTSRRSPRWNPI